MDRQRNQDEQEAHIRRLTRRSLVLSGLWERSDSSHLTMAEMRAIQERHLPARDFAWLTTRGYPERYVLRLKANGEEQAPDGYLGKEADVRSVNVTFDRDFVYIYLEPQMYRDVKVHLEEIRLNRGGYDRNGTYYGRTPYDRLYHVWSDGDANGDLDFNVRAQSRYDAKEQAQRVPKETFSNFDIRLSFYR